MPGYVLVDESNLDETNGIRYNNYWWRILLLASLYFATAGLVCFMWRSIYDDTPQYPPVFGSVPESSYRRAILYANSIHHLEMSHDFRLIKNQTIRNKSVSQNPSTTTNGETVVKANPELEDKHSAFRLVCYYTALTNDETNANLRLSDVSAELCNVINIGIADIQNHSIILSDTLLDILEHDVPILREVNANLSLLLWVGGGANSNAFPAMVKNHANRKIFIHSLKEILKKYHLDGVDIDWEFPSAYNKERQHFSQLLYEIKEEYKRERKEYLLSVAVAAPEGIALFAYDVRELNTYADYVNLMSYDYHFYTPSTPFTGLNAPLFPRRNEHSILATLNINYSVNWWLSNGLDRSKLVVGLPTYGHSFTLVNPFNNRIGAPASDIGQVGLKGFTSYSEICWFHAHNFVVSFFYDKDSCSPFLSSGTEWISFENEMSLECKARYIKSQNLGGAMLFSLNTDDFDNICSNSKAERGRREFKRTTFPLIETVKEVLTMA